MGSSHSGAPSSWAGSTASYWIAYKLGRPLVNRYGRFVLMGPSKIEAADHWFETYGSGGIFVARLLPGIRHVISIPAGLFRMPFTRFSLMTILGAGLFNGALAWFGMKVLGDQPVHQRPQDVGLGPAPALVGVGHDMGQRGSHVPILACRARS